MVCEMVCTEALVTLDDIFFYIFFGAVVYLDIYFTKKTWEKIKIIDPKMDFDDFELNKIAVTLVNKFGIKWGFRLAGTVSLSLFIILTLVINPIIIYFIAGAYFMVFAWHFHNLGKANGILEEQKKRKNLAMELAKRKKRKD